MAWPDRDKFCRRTVSSWQWFLCPDAYLMLVPSHDAETAVYVRVIRAETQDLPNALDEIPASYVSVVGYDELAVLPNALALAYASESDVLAAGSTGSVQHALDYIGVVPRRPALRERSAEEEMSLSIPRHMHMSARDPLMYGDDSMPTVQSNIGSNTEIALVNRLSGARGTIRVLSIVDGIVRVEWAMSGTYDLKKSKESGLWRSNPQSLLKHWDIDRDSQKLLDTLIAADRSGRKERQIQERFNPGERR